MNPDYETLLVGGVALYVIIDKILALLKNRGIDLRKLTSQMDDLHKWHDVNDSEGVKVWYVRKSLERAIDGLSESIKQETVVLNKIDGRLSKVEGLLNKL